MEIDRRQFLAGLGAGLSAATLGCGSRDRPAVVGNGPDAGVNADAGAPDAFACPADGCSAEQLLAPIETIVVLCMENRSFDHYFGSLRLLEGRAEVDGLTGAESNPDRNGQPVAVHPLDDFTPADPPHSWGACHTQWNSGANDGFVQVHAGANQADVMGYYNRAQLPMAYALADAGAVCHRWFASCLGPTWPNRFYLHAATAEGQQANFPLIGLGPTIWDRLAVAGLTGINYFHDIAWAVGALGKTSGLAPIEQFFDDAAAGTLPPFALIDPAFFDAMANDDHPDHDIRLGQALISSVVAALGASPQWNRCLFVLTYDEHGGFFDHVPPPALPAEIEPQPGFGNLGFRVPSLVIGPYVRRQAIDTVFDHTSIIATATRRFGLPPLNARVAAAADLSACIDPARLADPLPPPQLPAVEIDQRQLAARQGMTTPSHPELAAALDARPAPAHLDRRGQTSEIVHRVLRRGEQLGAVRLI